MPTQKWIQAEQSLFRHCPQGYEPNSEPNMDGRFTPIVDLTQDDDHTNSHMSDIPLQLPASANFRSTMQHWPRSHQQGVTRAKCSQSSAYLQFWDLKKPHLSATETTSKSWTSCDQLAHILLLVSSALTEWMAGKFIPTLDLTQDEDDTNSHASDIGCSFPRVQLFRRTSLHWYSFSQAEGDLTRNVTSLDPTSDQPGVNPWRLQYPSTYPEGSAARLGPQESVQFLTQRA